MRTIQLSDVNLVTAWAILLVNYLPAISWGCHLQRALLGRKYPWLTTIIFVCASVALAILWRDTPTGMQPLLAIIPAELVVAIIWFSCRKKSQQSVGKCQLRAIGE